ncbi:MAG TPA: four helix bundle protein [Phycisphaerales bacterium]|nr:four helix bundle protein [Phycisphaerales bacterium]
METSGEMVRSYRDLRVWVRGMDLAEMVYKLVALLPREEVFGLRSQLTRAAVSVPCNIAEGQGRMGDREFAQFLRVARGSLTELQTLLELVSRVKLIPEESVAPVHIVADDVGKMLTGLLARISRDLQRSPS